MSNTETPKVIEILKELTGAETLKETHISYALLGDEYVYKVKKGVDFGFLDYKLPKSRRAFCILEQELNNRFSKDIYLEVMKIVNRGQNKFELVSVENSVPAIEYVLKMKRIDDKDFLQYRVLNKQIDSEQMKAIGSQVASLLTSLDVAPIEDNFNSLADIVKFNAIENFNQTEKYTNIFIDKTLFNYIQNATLSFLKDNVDVINSRFEQGLYKNGHGDLRLEHIYFGADGNIGLIDCIEFNKRFRYNDVIAEAAFLSMEMDFLGYLELSDAFVTGFLEKFDDKDSVKLLNYYRSYYAYVRAKVTCFLLDEKSPTWEMFDEKQAEVRRLIDMSACYAYAMNGGDNLLFYGLMGTGKSKNARAFSKRFPIHYTSSDYTRKVMLGINPTDRKYVEWDSDIYSKENTLALYKTMGEMAQDKNKIGRLCVTDGSFSNELYHEQYAVASGMATYNVLFTAPEREILRRLDARLSKQDSVIADGRTEIYYEQKTRANFPKENITIDTMGDVGTNIDKIFKQMVL